MKKMIFILLGILVANSRGYSQMRFVDVPVEVQNKISAIVSELKATPPQYNLFLYNSVSTGRKSFRDSIGAVFNKYNTIFMPKYYADNWREVAGEYFHDSTGYRQLSYLYGVHKNIMMPLDSLTILSEYEFYKVEQDEFDGTYWTEEIKRNDSKVYVVAYSFQKKNYPLLTVIFNNEYKILAMFPSIYFDEDKGRKVKSFLKRHRK
ncbi:hypothetical protein ACTJIJ_10075 [Niabella sp. 22666]|uniref:hypothetical protein n=1 Tax=Niabella sp. 22666 TaxID=3453954 RepID=UPI003F826B82